MSRLSRSYGPEWTTRRLATPERMTHQRSLRNWRSQSQEVQLGYYDPQLFLWVLSGKHESRKPTMLENDIEVWYGDIDRFYYVFTAYLFYSYRAFVPKVHQPSCVCILHTKYSHAETSMSSKCKHLKDNWVISATPQTLKSKHPYSN